MPIIKRSLIHGFPRAYASEHGLNEAIVLKWLAHKTRKSKNYQEGKTWMYNSISTIAEQFPYLSRSQVARSLKNLEKAGLVIVGNFNKWKQDKTQWYHVPQPHRDAVEHDLIKFDVLAATQHGIPAAILLQNLRHWLKKQKGVNSPSQEMSPTKLSKLLPFLSKSTIKRELASLMTKGVIAKPCPTKPFFTFPTSAEPQTNPK